LVSPQRNLPGRTGALIRYSSNICMLSWKLHRRNVLKT